MSLVRNLKDCPEFSGKVGQRVYHFSYIDVNIVNSLWPYYWNWQKLPCLIQSEIYSIGLEAGEIDEFLHIQRNMQFYPRTGEVYSVIPNKTTSVLLTQGCLWGAFRWQCVVPHTVKHSESYKEIEAFFDKRKAQL